MRASVGQVRRIRELAYQLQVPMETVQAAAGVKNFNTISESTASRLISALLECDVRPLPADPEVGAARFAAALQGVAGQKKRMTPVSWEAKVADRLGLAATSETCPTCHGEGQIPARVTVRDVGRRLLDVGDNSAVSAKVVRARLEAPNFKLLTHVASWFDGDLNLAAGFCRDVVSWIDGEAS